MKYLPALAFIGTLAFATPAHADTTIDAHVDCDHFVAHIDGATADTHVYIGIGAEPPYGAIGVADWDVRISPYHHNGDPFWVTLDVGDGYDNPRVFSELMTCEGDAPLPPANEPIVLPIEPVATIAPAVDVPQEMVWTDVLVIWASVEDAPPW